MDDRSIGVVDSGIGGLNLLDKLRKKYPKENFVYFADGKNLPYGEKTKEELREIAKINYEKLLSFGVKAVVFACNTLTVSTVDCFVTSPVPVIGVEPTVKEGKGLLLCTPKTASSEFVNSLTVNNDLKVLPLSGLAEEIEKCNDFSEVDLESKFKGVSRDYDYVSLGCTHYPFLTESFKKIFPSSEIISGEEVVLSKIEKIMTTANPERKRGMILFVGEGRKRAKSVFLSKFQKK